MTMPRRGEMLDQERCWAALCEHDASQDGQWVYTVKTTGVYCRPGCASRQPLRKNVAFYATNAEAEAAGFRPCKRCRPNDGSQAERHIAAVERACALIRRSDALPSLDERASAAGISRYHFHRVFKQITGATPREWGKAHRLGRFGDRLDAGDNVAEAVYAAGFGASSRAYEAAPSGLGMTPAARRSGGGGGTIRLAPVETPDLPLDIRGTAFQARVWRALQKVPPGKTATYTEIAAALGQPKAVRAVAAACAANKLALLVPCHRIVRQDGDLAGYRWGIERKRALLAGEAAATNDAAAAE